LSLTLHPYKLLPGELEARLEGGLLLLPGQLLRFEGEPPASGPVYGRVVAVRTLSPEMDDDKESGLIRVRLLHGTPSMASQSVTPLTDAQMAAEVQRLLPETVQPIGFGESFTGDVSRLGPLTVIEGDDFLLKYEALMTLVRALEPYQRVVIVDPLGVSMPGEKMACFNAGEHLRLSLRDVGSKRFLDAFGDLFPDSLRESGLRTLVNLLPASQEFMGFKSFFTLEGIAEAPLRNLILQNCHVVAEAGIFADTPDEVLSLGEMLQESVNAVDI
jgi:hypothetical protein